MCKIITITHVYDHYHDNTKENGNTPCMYIFSAEFRLKLKVWKTSGPDYSGRDDHKNRERQLHSFFFLLTVSFLWPLIIFIYIIIASVSNIKLLHVACSDNMMSNNNFFIQIYFIRSCIGVGLYLKWISNGSGGLIENYINKSKDIFSMELKLFLGGRGEEGIAWMLLLFKLYLYMFAYYIDKYFYPIKPLCFWK